MPVGDCQRAFFEAAAEDGLVLTGQSFPWLSQQGHFGLERVAETYDDADSERLSQAIGALVSIYAALGGDPDVLRGGRTTALPGDFVHEPTGTLIEIDESQHFTSFRLPVARALSGWISDRVRPQRARPRGSRTSAGTTFATSALRSCSNSASTISRCLCSLAMRTGERL